MFNPVGTSEDTEFIELINLSPSDTIELGNAAFTTADDRIAADSTIDLIVAASTRDAIVAGAAKDAVAGAVARLD